MGKEIDDNEDNFEALLSDKRHKELISSLSKVLLELKKEKKDDGVKEAIENQTKAINDFSKAINKLKPEDKSQEIISAIETMQNEICESNNKVVAALNNKQIVDRFEIEKDPFGTTKTINVKYKSIGSISYSKPKAQA